MTGILLIKRMAATSVFLSICLGLGVVFGGFTVIHIDTEPTEILSLKKSRDIESTLVFHKDASDARLMFEFLLGGLKIDANHVISLQDEELASMERGRSFTALMNDHVPKSQASLQDLGMEVSLEVFPLNMHKFEQLLLGTVYSAYQLHLSHTEEEKQAWVGIFVQLANATLLDLKKKSLH
ncbi:protein FAM180A [Polypterus senegalus]|uniref:protein FAM180A n=1 Tax=Polypterus senegalus TaxID=55291 RepID=UPI00196493DB|nr:protein FAM180A [Polypterus senegalus]